MPATQHITVKRKIFNQMKTQSLFHTLCTLLLAAGLTLALFSCEQEKERPVRQPEANVKVPQLYLAGEAINGLPEELLLLSRDGNVHTYKGVLNSGSLYFQSVRGNNDGIYGQGADDSTVEPGSATPLTVEKGYYEFILNLDNNTITYKNKVVFTDKKNLYLAGDVITPAWGDHVMMPFACSEQEPFKYEMRQLLRAGICRFHFSMGLGGANIMKGADGSLVYSQTTDEGVSKGADNFSLSTDGEYKLTVDLIAGTATFTPISLFPDNISSVCVIGNTFGNVNGQVTWWAFWNIYQTPGLNRYMTRDAQNPNRYSLSANLDAGQGIVFTLNPYYQLPMLKKASDTTFEYISSFPDGNKQETVVPNEYLWMIDQAGNYTLSVDISTKKVSIVKN